MLGQRGLELAQHLRVDAAAFSHWLDGQCRFAAQDVGPSGH
jgi:hypothetical protein